MREGQATASAVWPGRRWARLRRAALGYVFIGPWLLAFLLFELIPLVMAFVFSLTEYSVVGPMRWAGLANYWEMFTRDPLFWISLGNTVFYIVFAVPLGIAAAFTLALLLNQPVRGTALLRTLFYLPAVVPTVAASIVWLWIFDTRRGILNLPLIALGLEPIRWLSSPEWAKPALILMSLWGIGGSMVIYLAGLQGIPGELYEAAAIDGASAWQRLRFITIPLMTPTILFTLIMGIISSFQVFNAAFIMTGGGPLNATLFYMLHIYNNAFSFFRMGYAAAMAVILFLLVLGLTAIIFGTSERWVYYGGGK